ncbi:MAG TPA: hybrid sensor histidine kinase/response regulator [Methylomirabilota bacterium]|nr:hybrid sensor histidine kinase/response regulator [Methylomirabilota bacterium]
MSPAPLTIAVVGGSSEHRGVVRDLFEPPRYQVLEAADGATGFDLIRREQPDCVLLDLGLPGRDGFALLERLRAESATRGIAVVVLAAGDEGPEPVERALRAGAVDYITRPASPEQLAVRVQATLERRRLMRELHDLRGWFTSMLGHDLRSPLTVIMGYVQLLEFASDALAPSHRRYLASIRAACTRMLGQLRDILDVSTLEAGTLTLQRAPVDLAALAAATVGRMRPAADPQSINLHVPAEPAEVTVEADANRLEQVLTNLLGHALRFSPAGGRVAVEVWADAGAAYVAVSDAGPGIPAAEAPGVFELRRSGAAASTRGDASGLGLVLCRYLVEAHGGTIRAEGAPGGGARFVLALPRAGGVSAPTTSAARG